MKKAAFVAALLPDLLATAAALYTLFKGDPKRAREALSILRDHGERLDRGRLEIDHALFERRPQDRS